MVEAGLPASAVSVTLVMSTVGRKGQQLAVEVAVGISLAVVVLAAGAPRIGTAVAPGGVADIAEDW